MRYFIELSYLGTNYHGWQIQPNAVSIQAEIQTKMSIQLGTAINIMGAGRTDAGVHAKQMFAHFDYDKNLPENYIHQLNAYLSKDIAIKNICEVRSDAHTRFDAIERSYEYKIQTEKNPFTQDLVWQLYQGDLNIQLMNECAGLLLLNKDFTSFAKLHTDTKTNFCDIRKAEWAREGSFISFTISADRFLRNMVRSIVGTLVEVGMGKLTKENFIHIIEKKDRNFASASAPAQGLYLTKVQYPEGIYL